MSENADAPPEHPAGNGEAQPTQDTQETTTNEPQVAADNTAQEPILENGNAEQPAADNTEQPAANGTPTPVDSGVQTEAMSADVNGSNTIIVDNNDQAATSIPAEPDLRPSVLIVGGLGRWWELVVQRVVILIRRQAISAAFSPTISTRTSLPQLCD